MARRFSHSEKEKWISSSSRQAKKAPIKIPAVNCETLIDEHRFTLVGRVTNPAIQKSRALYLEISLAGETKQVELEYEKLYKHCFSCLSLSHEVKDCPSRTTSRNTADQNLGISQRRTLERIEENRRRTDNRKLSRFSPYDDPRTHRGSAPTHVNQSQYGHERNKTCNHHYTERKEHSSDRSYSNRPYSVADNREKDSTRSREPRDRLPPVRESSEVSLRSRGMWVANPAAKNVWRPVSEGHGNGDHSNSIQSQVSHTPSPHPPRERITTPINTPQETSRPSGGHSGTPPSRRPPMECLSNADIISPTGERRSALARISTPAPRVPLLQNGVANSESGRLQEVNIQYLEEMFPYQTPEAESIPSSSRAPPKAIPIDAGIMERSPIRTLSEDRAHVSLRLGPLPVSAYPSPTPQALKAVGKKKKAAVTKQKPPAIRRVLRSPVQGISLNKRRVIKTQNSPKTDTRPNS
ncbi:hypothetical protein HID58_044156 [Brassica napus]|uniref:Zinc knuckle CX2CX4HX4C domain-containing protein n=1 Tax=Brassica napus TaxID=3708 RepID=A0ABQ8BIZ2_BRANA|nr:hypothetical protein HID58_044156 [Brassica napus]